MTPKVLTIPSGVPFAEALAKGVKQRIGGDQLALADTLIFVPTRRAARTLREAFVREQAGAALGPRIRALGDVEEDELSFDPSADDLELPPAIAPLHRRLLLATLVQRWHERRGEKIGLAQAVAHAGELARFLDEAHTQGVDLAQLDGLVTGGLATHWQQVVEFLKILAEHWPPLLKAEGAMEPALRRDEILKRVAHRFKANPPAGLVIAAGSTGSIPATGELLKIIANLPNGVVVLPGLDTTLDEKSWQGIEGDPGHPQYGLRQLLAQLDVERGQVALWGKLDASDMRARFLSEALRPPPTTDAWRDLAEREKRAFAQALDGLALVEATTPREEALVIACALREVLETPGRTAALVTPDRSLARRVAAELARWDITIDDSAGQPLDRTQPGAFLVALARAAAEQFAPVPLLALLKHPLAAGGGPRVDFLHQAREMEKLVLRGLRPSSGLAGIAAALTRKEAPPDLMRWFARVTALLKPFIKTMAKKGVTLSEIAQAHGLAAEAFAATQHGNGPANLWRNDAGEAAAHLVSELWESGRGIPLGDTASYAELFRELAETRAVRPAFGHHSRLAILGPLEARLMHFDLVVLGGLNEGTWPAEATTDPWLSRPLRAKLGLETPERRIGLAAHDFATLAASPEVLLTRALKQDGAPTVASRWLLRLKQLAKGLELEERLRHRPLLAWARALDDSPRATRAARPAPKPPVAARPRGLGVTEIETWQRDPYAIYSKYVLGLKPFDPIDMEAGPAERGSAIHSALENFLREYPNDLPANAGARLLALGDEAFLAEGASPAVLALWRPRFVRAARWFLEYEQRRRPQILQSVVEQAARLEIASTGGTFTLRGRADRIDLLSDSKANIVDYKTGRLPGQNEVKTLLNPQLPLEAAMLLRGCFAGLKVKGLHHLIYVQLSGGELPGGERIIDVVADNAAAAAYQWLSDRIAAFDNPATPYRSRVCPRFTTDVGNYDHLARVREWSVYGEGGSEGEA